ncbi:ATP-binding cassette, subfamily B, heavy metal transporter [Nematocida ausubeli]|nr:ATP-binding cassette, subfamily B, heavy metal transporter [Nematocida ausubeli]
MHKNFSELPRKRLEQEFELIEDPVKKAEKEKSVHGKKEKLHGPLLQCAGIIYAIFVFSFMHRRIYSLFLLVIGITICLACNHASMKSIIYQSKTILEVAENTQGALWSVFTSAMWIFAACVMREIYTLLFTLFTNHTLYNVSTSLFRNSIYAISPIASARINRVIDRGNRGVRELLTRLLVKILANTITLIITYAYLFKMDWMYVAVITGFNVLYVGISAVLLRMRMRNKVRMNKCDDLYTHSIIECMSNKDSILVNNTEQREVAAFNAHIRNFLNLIFYDCNIVAALNVVQKSIYTAVHVCLMAYIWMYGKQKMDDIIKLMMHARNMDHCLMEIAISAKEVLVNYVDCKLYIEYITGLSIRMELPAVSPDDTASHFAYEDRGRDQYVHGYRDMANENDENRQAYNSGMQSEIVDAGCIFSGSDKLMENVAIEFNNVSCTQENSTDVLIKNFSCKIFEGEKVCIVGKSGSGKTTLILLLLKQKRYTGTIKVHGVDIQNMTKKMIVEQVGIVPQDSSLFNNTIMYNIEYGSAPGNKALSQVLSSMEIDEIVRTKQEGYEYNVGVSGKNLSGGEKQKVRLARCLLRETGIIILDEATSKLDCLVENRIINMLCATDKTVIIITHSPIIASVLGRIIEISPEST